MNLESIIPLARKYAAARAKLAGLLAHIESARQRILKENLAELRRLVRLANDEKATVENAILTSPDVFRSPRTQCVDGIKFGLGTAPAKITIDNENAVIEAIRKKLPGLSKALIHTRETPNKEALAKLTDDQLKSIGVTRLAARDIIVLKDTASDVDKLVTALLEKAEPEPDTTAHFIA